MKLTDIGLELETEKKEVLVLFHAGERTEIDEIPELEDFFGRLQFASACTRSRDKLEQLRVAENTRFTLTEAGDLVIPEGEFGLLHQGLKIILQDPVYNNADYRSQTAAFLTELLTTIEVGLPVEDEK